MSSNVFEKHGIQHLSASSVNLFAAQPAMWCARYLMGKSVPVGPAAHRGTAVEHGVEAGLFDPEMHAQACVDMAMAKFNSLVRFSSEADKADKEREGIPGMVETALAELRQYGVPDKPEGDRQWQIMATIEGVPVPVMGYLDFLWTQHGIIGDLKTTLRVPSSILPSHNIQGAIYAHDSNMQVRMMYTSPKKIHCLVVEDVHEHINRFRTVVSTMERFLDLTSDGEKLTKAVMPDLSSFWWNTPAAQAMAQEIWT